jgi:hypothetical protein
MQELEPGDVGPRLKLEGGIWYAMPPNVMETTMLKLQGTCQTLISQSSGQSTREHTRPGPAAESRGARDQVIDGLYSLDVTDDLVRAGGEYSAGARFDD